jgi:4-amino-4-deoxy-L-arabinose transferase-like glycosyltransferase
VTPTSGWWWWTGGLTAARLALAAGMPLGDDEGYYWVWSRHLAAGYHDHPPLVAWLVAVSTRFLGDTHLGLRLPFVLIGTLAALALRGLVRDVTGDDRLARATSLLFQVVPVFLALGVLVIPDSPLQLFWLLGARAAWKARRGGGLADWAAVGFVAGAALTSKYVGVLLPLSLAGYALAARPPRAGRGLLVAGAVAALVFAPVLAWNAQHDWISFRYQFATRHRGAGFEVERLGLYLGSQALYLSPLLFGLAVPAALRLGLWRLRREEEGARFLWWLAAPTLAVFLVAGGLTRFKPNWPSPGYLTLLPIVLLGLQRWAARAPRPAAVVRAAATALAAGCALLPALHALHPWVPLPRQADPTVDMRGWPDAARLAKRALADLAASAPPGAAPFLAAGRYQNAARLEFYAGGKRPVLCLDPARDAYDDWQDLRALRGRDFVFVATDRFPAPPERLVGVASSRVFATVHAPAGKRERHTITVYECRGFSGELAGVR